MSEYRISIDSKAARDAINSYVGPLFERRMRGALLESSEYLKGEVQTRITNDRGLLRGSIFAELRGSEMAIVGTPLAYGVVVERGRSPGSRMPPVDVIEAWASRHGMAGAGFVIARAIARRGIPGRWMFRDAAAAGRATVLRIFLNWFGRAKGGG